MRRSFFYLWTLPNTLIGLTLGLAMLAFGGRVRQASGALEFSDGWLGRILSQTLGTKRFCAITFGHTIVGVSGDELLRLRVHEQVHVRQYERWGPLFLPAYLLASVWTWTRGGRPYRDNVFERQAFAAEKSALQSKRS